MLLLAVFAAATMLRALHDRAQVTRRPYPLGHVFAIVQPPWQDRNRRCGGILADLYEFAQ
jgi:hypothetical protein